MQERPPFREQLASCWQQADSLLCVGLDPLPERFPAGIRRDPDGALEFCQRVVDASADLVCAYKPQAAHFAALGAEPQLQRLIEYIHQRYPQIPVILDAKRGDIGSTADRYAFEAYVRYGADAVTLNPYLGPESIVPFLKYQGKGAVVLCRTSNPDSDWLQRVGEPPVFMQVAQMATTWAQQNSNLMLVAGATYPQELSQIRALVGEMPLLVPGLGVQGGSVDAVLQAAALADGSGLAINVSRAVLYCSTDTNFEEAVRTAAQGWQQQLCLAKPPGEIFEPNDT